VTKDILPNDADKHFEINNNLIRDISFIADNLYSSDINSVEKALYYHSYGFNIIPIPKRGEKIGQTWDEKEKKFVDEIADGKSAKGYVSWSQWQSKQQTSEDITKLFHDKKDCNIAILTGKVSRIIAFDIDGEEAEKYFDKVVESLGDTETENAIKNTMQTKSGSGQGKHIILRFNPEDFQNGRDQNYHPMERRRTA
jgi:hypothetical protein